VPHDTRDQVIDFVRRWHERTEIATQRFVRWLGVASCKFYNWRARYGKANDNNGRVPRDFWLEASENQAILDFYDRFPLEGYRRLTFMMLAGSRRSGGEPGQHLAGSALGEPTGVLEPQAV
jgi:hypothetical protein